MQQIIQSEEARKGLELGDFHDPVPNGNMKSRLHEIGEVTHRGDRVTFLLGHTLEIDLKLLKTSEDERRRPKLRGIFVHRPMHLVRIGPRNISTKWAYDLISQNSIQRKQTGVAAMLTCQLMWVLKANTQSDSPAR